MRATLLGSVLGGALLAALIGSCSEESSRVVVTGNGFLKPPECTLKAAGDATVLLRGTLDIALSSTYVADLIFGNQMISRASRDQLRTETDGASMQEATVLVTTVIDGVEGTVADYTTPSSGYASAADEGGDPGYGIASVVIVPAVAVDAVRDQVLTKGSVELTTTTTLIGKTTGNHDLESMPFVYVVNLCYGCLIAFPEGSETCDSTSKVTLTGGCRRGQDGYTPCTSCLENPACQAR